jgi:hypothetical protein
MFLQTLVILGEHPGFGVTVAAGFDLEGLPMESNHLAANDDFLDGVFAEWPEELNQAYGRRLDHRPDWIIVQTGSLSRLDHCPDWIIVQTGSSSRLDRRPGRTR